MDSPKEICKSEDPPQPDDTTTQLLNATSTSIHDAADPITDASQVTAIPLNEKSAGRPALDDLSSTLKSLSVDDATIVPALAGRPDTEHKAISFEDLSYDMRFLLWKWLIKDGRFIETNLDLQPVSLARLDGRQNSWRDFVLAVHFIPYHAGLVPIFFKNEIKAKKSFYPEFVRRYNDLILLGGRRDNIFHLNFAWPVLEKLFAELEDRVSHANDSQRLQPEISNRLSLDFITSAPIIVDVRPRRPLERLSLHVVDIPGQGFCESEPHYIDVFAHLITALGVRQLNLVLTAFRLTDVPTHGGHLWAFKPGGSSTSTTEMKIHIEFMLATRIKGLIKERAQPGLEVNVVQWDTSGFTSNGNESQTPRISRPMVEVDARFASRNTGRGVFWG